MIDGQHQAHGEGYAYSSDEWPEFYDLWIESLFGPGPFEDALVFWDALQEVLIKQPPSAQGVTVVDLGTGTGRVIKDLLGEIASRSTDFRIQLIGIDHSRSMLQRAGNTYNVTSSRAQLPPIAPKWVLGSVADFIEKLPRLRINYLIADGETRLFLQEVRKGLREGGGSVAIVSVLHEFIPAKDKPPQNELSNTAGDGLQEEVRIPSRDYLGLVYIKTPTAVTRSGNIRTDRFSVKAVKERPERSLDDSTSHTRVEWEKDMAWSMRMFNEKVWQEEIDSVGLEIKAVKEGEIQRWHFIQLALVGNPWELQPETCH